jgi:hypothetical protein
MAQQLASRLEALADYLRKRGESPAALLEVGAALERLIKDLEAALKGQA